MELEGIRLLCGRGSFLFSEAKVLSSLEGVEAEESPAGARQSSIRG
jgi:hypothetical protein